MGYSFYFLPTKLQEVLSIIQKHHPTLEEVVFNNHQFEKHSFSSWFESVRDYSYEEIARLMGSKGRDQILYALKNKPDKKKREKLLAVLRYCKKESLYQLNWAMLQVDYTNLCLMESMVVLGECLNEKQANLYSEIRWCYLEDSTENLVDKIVDRLIKENIDIKNFFSKYEIIKKSKLAIAISDKFFQQSHREGFLQNREIFKQVIECRDLRSLGLVINRYLEVLEPTVYFKDCNERILEVFGRPIKDCEFWTGISKNAQEKFTQWVNLYTLEEYFGSNCRKFVFWKKHYKDMSNVIFLQDCNTIFIYFDSFVIVDTDSSGEYAYLYKKNIFTLEYEMYTRDKNQGIWTVDPSLVITAHDAIIEKKHGAIYSLKYEQAGILYMNEIIKKVNESKEMGVVHNGAE